MLAWVRTPSGATRKDVLQLEATFIDVKNMYSISTGTRTRYAKYPGSSPGGDTCFSNQ